MVAPPLVSGHLTAKHAGQRFLTPRGFAGLGWGLPLGMGAKLARPGARVVAIVGDGGFAPVWSEVETFVRERTPVVVILNNAILGYQRHVESHAFGAAGMTIQAPGDPDAYAPVRAWDGQEYRPRRAPGETP